jgi:hypothetical protein
MNFKCGLNGHDWKLDYPAEESEWIADPLRIWVCQRCGKAKSVGQHQKIPERKQGE